MCRVHKNTSHHITVVISALGTGAERIVTHTATIAHAFAVIQIKLDVSHMRISLEIDLCGYD